MIYRINGVWCNSLHNSDRLSVKKTIKPWKTRGYSVLRELAGSPEHNAVFMASFPLVFSLIHCGFEPGKRDGQER